MRRVIVAVALFVPAVASALPVTLAWDAYPEPEGHDIQVYCRVADAAAVWRANVPAAESGAVVEVEAQPGQAIGCQVRARRIVGDDREQWPKSEFSAEAVAVVPFAVPPTPAGLSITLPSPR